MIAKFNSIKAAFFLLLITPFALKGQYVFNKRTDIPANKGANPALKYPWTGGFNNPQFSSADLNNDGIMDLMVFDRTGDAVVTFLNNGAAGTIDYVHSPKYESSFYGFSQWVLMDDFDCDGIEDVFTYNIGAADYYRGYYTGDNVLHFDSVTFLGYPSTIGSGILNIFISAADIPAFVDVNNDGDLDVLTFEQLGGQVVYFENQAMELTGSCADTVLFRKKDECWGAFYEPSNTNVVMLNHCRQCFTPLNSGVGHIEYKADGSRAHAGSTLLSYDEDGDGDKELILGDISFEAINRLVNCGTPDTACICDQDPTFPPDKPYKLPIFPASFYVDVDNDNLRDLIVAPNQQGTSENYNCAWLYKNVGTADSVVFEYVSDTFLIGETLDFGEGAYPAFFDYNNDGLLDLVVGNYGYYTNGVTYVSELALLENVGTTTSPSFKLVDLDFGRVSELARKAIHPAFGDLDADGDQDMIVGEFDGFLHYYRNDAAPGAPASFTLVYPQMFGIDVGQFSSPFIYDVNGDSLPDLIVGEKSGNGTAQRRGEVNYFENIGSATNFVFETLPTNDVFGEMDVRIPGFPNGYCTPIFSALDSSGTVYVVSGSEEGTIKVFEFDQSKIYTGAFTKKFNAYSEIDEGERTSVAIADLTGDGKMEMVVGNYRGGLSFFTQSDTIYTETTQRDITGSHAFQIAVFPNPSGGFVQLQLSNCRASKVNLELLDMMGRNVWSQITEALPMQQLQLPAAATGMYFLKVTIGDDTQLKKIVIRQ